MSALPCLLPQRAVFGKPAQQKEEGLLCLPAPPQKRLLQRQRRGVVSSRCAPNVASSPWISIRFGWSVKEVVVGGQVNLLKKMKKRGGAKRE